jgi:putative sigma-54 modulation protein
MQLNIESPHFEVKENIRAQIMRKLDSLEKDYNRLIDCDILLKTEKNSRGLDYISEIKINAPKKVFFAKAQAMSLDVAVSNAMTEIETQVLRHKQKFA